MKDIANYFEFDKLHTNFKREFVAWITTFVSMAYILFVNPSVLGASGMDKGAVFAVTAVSAAFACLVMGLYAKYPFASAPSLLYLFSLHRNAHSVAKRFSRRFCSIDYFLAGNGFKTSGNDH